MTAESSRKIWPLPGGVYVEANKAPSLRAPVTSPPLPHQLVIALTQPASISPILCAAEGDYVLKGQVLAHGSSDAGINIHASTSGTIIRITPHAVPNTSGEHELCVILQPDREERWTRMAPVENFTECSSELLYARIKDAGIRGLGGAAFPTHAKLVGATNIHTLVLNISECEPFISCDEALVHKYLNEVITGTQILLHASGATRCLIGIEDSKPAAIRALRAALSDPRIELVVVPALYPSGAERQLIYSLTGVEITADTLPVEKGFLCHNPGTALAVMRAVIHGEPMISRVTTVTGAALAAPANYEVLFGTPINELLQLCGVDNENLSRLIIGGSLMGTQITSAEVPVLASTNCILATTHEELPAPLPEQPCIRCGFCVPACPVLLQPQVLYWDSRQLALTDATSHHLADCIECGACAYVCPSHIPLVQYFRAAKAEIRIEAEQVHIADSSRQRFEFHQARVHAEKVQQELRRAERAALMKPAPEQPLEVNSAQATIAAALARVKAKKLEQALSASNNTKTDEGETKR
ncbi:MAG: electron transport complex subunit RsxC [Pseudomonadota bacterium]